MLLRRSVIAVLVALGLVITALPFGLDVMSAATCTASQLQPALRDVTVDQGVGSYGKLVRGKQAIVRFYLTLPTGCTTSLTQSVTPTGASLSVQSPTPAGATFVFPAPYRPLSGKLAKVIAADVASDPLFQVPGSTFQPLSTTAEFQIGLSVKVTYTRKSDGVTTPGLVRTFSSFGGAAITRTVEQRTNALRVLVVPMGDASLPYETQFRDVERGAVIKGMSTLARVLPVPDGTGDLAGTSGGIRYTISAGLLDIGPSGLSLLDAGGTWCGSDSTFNAVKGPLAAILQDWNNTNPGATADRVLGVVGVGISRGSGPGSPCDEGRATVPRPDQPAVAAYVRAIPDSQTTPSMTGALMVMELAHTFGVVSPSDAGRTLPGTFHSLNTEADGTDPDRAYNLTQRAYIAADRTAMHLTSGWTDTSVLLEKNDWEFLACALGGQTTSFCTVSNTAGTSEGIAAGPMFVLTGTTDGTTSACTTHAGTCVTESYYNGVGPLDDGAAETSQDPASTYRLLYLDASGAVLNDDGLAPLGDGFGVPVSVAETEHGSIAGESAGDPDRFLFSVAFPFTSPDTTDKIQLVRLQGGTSTLLYERNRTAAPLITRLSTPLSQSRIAFAWDDPADDALADTGADIYSMNGDGSNVVRLTTTTADDSQPRVSPDGRMVAFTRTPSGGGDSELYVAWENRGACLAAGPCSGATAFPDETNLTNDPTQADANPDWSPDGERLIFDTLVAPGDHDVRWLTYTSYFADKARWFEGAVTVSIPLAASRVTFAPDATATTFVVDDPERLPRSGPYTASIDDEHVTVTAGFGSPFLAVVRGVDGTTAAAHAAKTVFQPIAVDPSDDRQPVWSSSGTSLAFTTDSIGGTSSSVAIAGIETSITYESTTRGRNDWMVIFPPDIAAGGGAFPAGQQDAFDPDWLRGNDQLVFTTNWNGNHELYTYDFSEERLERLTDDPANDRYPSVDEASGRILFRSDRDGGDRVFRMDTDGTDVVALPDAPAAQPGSDPAWYPRDPQSRILFSRFHEPSAPGLYDVWTMNPDGSDAQALTTGGISNGDARWSPDGRRIAYSGYYIDYGRSDIYVMDADGSDTIELTRDLIGNGSLPCSYITPPEPAPASLCEAFAPVWSPDGKRVAFAYGGDGQIWALNADGSGGPTQITNEATGIGQFAWSPDGTRIAYALRDATFDESHIFIIHPDGTGRMQLTFGSDFDDQPAWSPDSTTLAIARKAPGAGGSDIVSIDALTGAYIRTYAVSDGGHPATSFENPSWSPDGRQLSFSFFGPITGCFFNCFNGSVMTVDADGEALVQRAVDTRVSHPDWSPGEDTVYAQALMDGDPLDARADLYYDCGDGGPVYPIAVAVEPISIDGAIANFQANFDPAFACGDGTPQLTVRVNDGYSISMPSSPEPYLSSPKPAAAAIAGPRAREVISPFAPLPLIADTYDPEAGRLEGAAYAWSIDGVPVSPDPGDPDQTPFAFDVPPPGGHWSLGLHTVSLSVTDDDVPAHITTTTSRFQVVATGFAWVAPTKPPPKTNTGTAGGIVSVRFRLGGDAGLDILPAASPFSQHYVCGHPGQLQAGTQYHARPFSGGLSYDALTQIYTFAWQTNPGWTGNLGCRQFQLRLLDGLTRVADYVLTAP